MTYLRNAFSPVFAAALCAVVVFASTFGPSRCFAQPVSLLDFSPPQGEATMGGAAYDSTIGKTSLPNDGRYVDWSQKSVTLHIVKFGKLIWEGTIYNAPMDRTVKAVIVRDKGSGPETFVILDDGSVVEVTRSSNIDWGKANTLDGEGVNKLVGDALYMLTTQKIFVSRDTGHTWIIDTTGLGGQPNDIAVDSEQFVYAVTYNGLFRQSPDSNIWRAMTLPALAGWNKIFVDRLDHIYLGGAFSGKPVIYRSLDRGTTWTADTAGLGTGSMFSFGDDAYGNIYAITAFSSPNAGNQIYRSNGTNWTRIDQPITGANTDSLNQQAIFTAVGGDSVLVATTIYGVFSSSDQGTTWTESNDGIPANYFYGLVKTPSNRWLTSTNLGVFGINPSNTAWKKTYPQTGYLGGQPLFSDNSGAIYTLGPVIAKPDFSTNFYPPRVTMKSIDGGIIWEPDTLGLAALSKVPTTLFSVDETGTQHLATYGVGAAPSSIYVKFPGQPWAGDTLGFVTNHNAPQAFGSDGRGSLWMSIGSQTIPTLLRRAVIGGAWAADTVGLGGEILNSFAAAKNGTVYAGGFAGVWRKSGSTWSKLPPPSGIYTTEPAYSVSIDSSGALIAGYQHFDINYNSIGDGVFATTNDGQTWTNLGHIDTTTFKQFISYGDTTYGISYKDGMFVFTTGASGVVDEPTPELAQLDIYPNPTSGNVTIEVKGAISTQVEVFDELGNLLRAFSGTAMMSWDGRDAAGSDIASGVYFVRVTGVDEQGQPFRASKELVIQR